MYATQKLIKTESHVSFPVKNIFEHFKHIQQTDLTFLRVQKPIKIYHNCFPVMPPQDRPSVHVSDKEYNDDLTTKYCSIIKFNSFLIPKE